MLTRASCWTNIWVGRWFGTLWRSCDLTVMKIFYPHLFHTYDHMISFVICQYGFGFWWFNGYLPLVDCPTYYATLVNINWNNGLASSHYLVINNGFLWHSPEGSNYIGNGKQTDIKFILLKTQYTFVLSYIKDSPVLTSPASCQSSKEGQYTCWRPHASYQGYPGNETPPPAVATPN